MPKKDDDILKKLTNAMEEVQTGKRFQHTLGVEFTAASMAMKYGMPVWQAQLAGLLHDCAKCLSDEKLLKVCNKNNLSVSDIEKRNPYLLHGKVGAFLAKTEYGIEDEDILNAIEWHTTGRPGMSELEKIIFIADYIEPGRKQAPNLTEVRKLAFENLDQAMIKILKDTLEYLKSGKGEIDPMTLKTYQYYTKNCE
ncbi:MAG: bis(5'-nucleosyl)-tetraphosphatase (symmetrical) YqeK [Lachnospiraceae bacterium]|nr:bis(5'-nucleosyl)-tetraphosphatase (symmetrical) YqeK [Lachnospiraceae bacterium]MBR4608269.1 bis(5'-nucleosyl)-tetraphosphatase (symmetrical) YqeK [Lachnospiraceae bacterium]MBR6150790.1 bis(5'-nucleosyl)-tetraphosphatase (symmetrical) YqeK [Lachnospiraceae bacterium]